MKLLVAAIISLAGGCAAFLGCSDKSVKAPTLDPGITTVAPSSGGTAAAQAAAPSSNPGEIACGKATCKVGNEVCCSLQGACEPIPKTGVPGDACEAGHTFRCDSRDDCASGELCCWLHGDPADVTMCIAGRCPETEACYGRSGCAAGFSCKKQGTENEPGTCVFANPQTQCGKITCSGAKPVCRWNPDDESGACVDSGKTEPTETERDVKCSGSADCGGESCCAAGGTTWCGACVNHSVVCKTKADCPAQLGGGEKLSGCGAVDSPGWAPWLKTCEYGDP